MIARINTSRQSRRQDRRSRGFTLLEIMVVVVIIALLATLVMPGLWDRYGKSQANVAQARAAQIGSAVRMYLMDHGMGRIPPNFDLHVLVEAGQLREKDTIDPWGLPFILIIPGDENPDFDVVSYGPDGELGTEDDVVH